jgi:hypothetical protein
MEVQGGGGRGAHRHGAVAHQHVAHREHGTEPDELGEVEPAEEPGPQPGRFQRQLDGLPGSPPDTSTVVGPEPERAHRRGAAHGVEQLLLLGADRDPLPGVERSGPAGVPPHGVQLDRHRQRGRHQETPVEHGEAGQGQDDHQDRAGERGQRLAHRLADHRDVVADPRGQVAGAGPLHPVERQPQRPVDEAFPHVGQHPLAERRHQARAHGEQDALCDGHDRQQYRRGRDDVDGVAAPRDHHVDDPAQQRRGGEADRGRGDEPGQGAGRQRAVRTHHLAERRAGARRRRHRQQFALHERTAVR